MRGRLRAILLHACAASAAVTWLACSDDPASPIAPTPSVAPDASVNSGPGLQVTTSPGLHEGSGAPATQGLQVGDGTGTAAVDLVGDGAGAVAVDLLGDGTVAVDLIGDGAGAVTVDLLGDGTAAAADGLAIEGIESQGLLKASAPRPRAPINNVEVTELQPLLVAERARGRFVDATFDHQFEVYRVVGGSRERVVSGRGIRRGDDETSYRLPRQLQAGASFVWRVRALRGGDSSAWSQDARFRTVAFRLGVPRPLSPIENRTVGSGTDFTVRNPAVAGRVQRSNVSIEIQVARGQGFANPRVGRAKMRDGGTTVVRLSQGLASDTRYYWRARATAPAGSGRVTSAWSDTASFRTAKVSVGAPQPLAPVRGATVGVDTHFRVRNGKVEGFRGRVYIQVQVALNRSFKNPVKGQTHARERGETNIPLERRLQPDKPYFWRARSRAPRSGAAGDLVSPWSATANFRTASAAGPGPGPVGPFGPPGPPRNMVHVVREVASQNPAALRNSCQSGGGSWTFMDLLVERLRRESGRWGYNCKRGDCAHLSEDVVAYYQGGGTKMSDAQGKTNVAIIDVIINHCASNPQPAWTDMTQKTKDAGSIGRWKYPRR